MHVARVIDELRANGVSLSDVFIEVRPGELELRYGHGSYGVRRFNEVKESNYL